MTLTGALAVAVMLTRSTAGWAIALAVVATGLWFLAGRRRQGAVWRRAGWGLVVAGAATMLVGSLVNWAKFRHPYLFPIEDQVWTQLSAHRRFAVADNGGALNGLQFVRTTLAAYLRPDGVRFVSVFPFITPPADPPTAFGGVLLDESWRTGSVPALMPLLFLLTVWGAIVASAPAGGGRDAHPAARLRPDDRRRARLRLRRPALHQRVPATARARRDDRVRRSGEPAAIGHRPCQARRGDRRMPSRRLRHRRPRLHRGGQRPAVLARRPPRRPRRPAGDRRPTRSAARSATVSTSSTPSLHTARPTTSPSSANATRSSSAPARRTDPGSRSTTATAASTSQVTASGVRPGSTSLMWFSGFTLRRLQAQVNLAGQLRLVMIGASPDTSGHWLDIEPGDTVGVTVADDTEGNRFVATAHVERTAQRSVVEAPMTEWNRQFRSVPIFPSVALNGRADAGRIGLQVSVGTGPPPPLCDRLR